MVLTGNSMKNFLKFFVKDELKFKKRIGLKYKQRCTHDSQIGVPTPIWMCQFIILAIFLQTLKLITKRGTHKSNVLPLGPVSDKSGSGLFYTLPVTGFCFCGAAFVPSDGIILDKTSLRKSTLLLRTVILDSCA